MTIEELVQKAKEVADKAYAPYSNFYVGSALLTRKGNVFTGCNVENASYGGAICAERNAITTAVAQEGKEMIIHKIVIVTSNDAPAPPCGICRQFIAEFADYGSNETEIIFLGKEGRQIKKVSEVLPFKFEF